MGLGEKTVSPIDIPYRYGTGLSDLASFPGTLRGKKSSHSLRAWERGYFGSWPDAVYA